MFGRLESNQRIGGTKLRRLTVLATPDRFDVVWAVRFELTISCFRRTQDGQLPYAHAIGCGGRNRTGDGPGYEPGALPLCYPAVIWSATSDSNAHVV